MKKRVSKKILVLGSLIICLMLGSIVVYASDIFWGGEDNISEINGVLDKLKSKIDHRDDKLKQSKESIARKVQTIDSKNKELKRLQSEIATKESKIESLSQEVSQLKASQAQYINDRQQFNELLKREIEIERQVKDKEIDKYIKQVNNKTNEISEKSNKIQQLEDEVVKVKREYVKIQDDISELKQAKQESDDKLTKARQDVESLKNRANAILQEVEKNESIQ